ncbi:N-methyl-L-tryptophan oxidase [Candidatus Poribacteria bacterium]|nr:N-methyl-L-tryptophan oxidase [Candidatus Poribacteria bacterium]
MSKEMYDAIVIGAGGMGSATAYHLAKSGAKTLLLEQFHRGHTFGSSHGDTRIIRLVYEKQFYTELMKSAYAEWRALESVSGKALMFVTGSVLITPDGHEYSTSIRASLEAAGIESEWWSPKQLASRFPQFRIDKNQSVLWQKDTGFLHASECVLTHLQLAEGHGAEVREQTAVTGIDWERDVPEVITEGGRLRAKKIVVTAGAWAKQLLSKLNLPLTVTRQQIVYYRPTDASLFQPDRFPIFIDVTWDEFFYGFPVFGREGVKVARHGKGQVVSPNTCNRTPDAEYIDHLRAFLKERIPDAAGEALYAQVCLYTETPDEDFIIDAHPDCPDVLIATGFSGHGFKFCSLVGRILSEMVREGQTRFDINPFRLDRFGEHL